MCQLKWTLGTSHESTNPTKKDLTSQTLAKHGDISEASKFLHVSCGISSCGWPKRNNFTVPKGTKYLANWFPMCWCNQLSLTICGPCYLWIKHLFCEYMSELWRTNSSNVWYVAVINSHLWWSHHSWLLISPNTYIPIISQYFPC